MKILNIISIVLFIIYIFPYVLSVIMYFSGISVMESKTFWVYILEVFLVSFPFIFVMSIIFANFFKKKSIFLVPYILFFIFALLDTFFR